MNRKVKKAVSKIGLYIVLCVVAFIFVLPFYWSVLISFRQDEYILRLPLIWIPVHNTFEHYVTVFESVPFFRYLGNTVFVTVMGLVMNLFFGTLAAYAFAKIDFAGNKIIFKIMLSSMMIPGVVTLTPLFLVLSKIPLAGGNNILGQGGIGLINTHWAIILPGAIGVYGIFFMRQFFLNLSNDLGEAARLDGASEFRIFSTIYVPLVLPAMMTLGIFCFQSGWNNFMWPNIVLFDSNKYVLTVALSSFKYSSNGTDYGPMMAFSILMSLPIIILFGFAQKYFISGVALGGVKE